MIYLDSAAVVKLVHADAESAALRNWLDERADTGWISSVLTEIESFRALARYAPGTAARLPAMLDLIDLIPLDSPIRIAAQTVRPATVRRRDLPRHRPTCPPHADRVRHLRQAPAGRGNRSRTPSRSARLAQHRQSSRTLWYGPSAERLRETARPVPLSRKAPN
jgi:uncharacterized protein